MIRDLELVETIYGELRASRKYAHLAEAALRRTAAWAAERHPTAKPAVKAAKAMLHQVYGAFAERIRFNEVDAALSRLSAAEDDETRKAICRSVLEGHASTRERISILDELYSSVFQAVSGPRRVLDLGCGLNPFTLPWMNLPRECEYIASELDTRLIDRIARLLSVLERPGSATASDLLAPIADTTSDVVLLLKIIPTLEQQEKGAAKRIIEQLDAWCVVFSFPLKTLGGRDVGMEYHYSSFVDALELGTRWQIERRVFSSELVYVLRA